MEVDDALNLYVQLPFTSVQVELREKESLVCWGLFQAEN